MEISQPGTLTEEVLEVARAQAEAGDPTDQPPPFDPDDPDGSKRAEAERLKRVKEHRDYFSEMEEGRQQARVAREEVILGEGLPESAKPAHEKLTKGLMTRDQYVKQERPLPLVQGLLNMDSLSWIAGPSGSLKSFVAADLAFRYGTEDMTFHNRKMTHGRALYVVAEGGSGFAGRILAWEKEHRREVTNVDFYPAPLQLGDMERDTPALVHLMATERDAGRPYGLVIFDTQSLCTAGVDENTDMARIINVMHQLRRVNGACIMPVHHTGKDISKGMRGSSAIHAAADTVIMAIRAKNPKAGPDEEDDDDTPQPLRVTLSTAREKNGKQKDLTEEDKALVLEMEVHDVDVDHFGDTITSLVPLTAAAKLAARDTPPPPLPEVTEGRKKFLMAMRLEKGNHSTTSSELGKRVGESRSYTRDVLLALEKDDLVRSTKSGAAVHWQVTQTGLRKIDQLDLEEVIWSPASARQEDRNGLSAGLSDSRSDSRSDSPDS